MGVIAGGGGARAVIVREKVPVRSIQQQTDVLQVPQQVIPVVAVDADTQRSIAVSSPGVQGQKGDAGAVTSINGMVGDVVLDAEDVQADPEGAAIAAASSAMSMHLADPDPHPQYIESGDILDGGNF